MPSLKREKYFFLFLSFTEGAAVMVAELVSAKMLAPLYGSSLYVWGSVIGVTLLGLTSGYFLGGLLSYSKHRRGIVCWSLLGAALLIAVMPSIGERLMLSLEGLDLIPAILLSASVFLLPPLLLLGAASPLIIATLSNEVADAGKASGTVYAISTIGGILSTLLSGFYLIPEFGLTLTAQATGIALIILPFLLLLRMRHYPAVAIPALMVLVMLPHGKNEDYPVTIQYRSEGMLGQLLLVDVPLVNRRTGERRIDRILFVNRVAQSWMNLNTGEPIWDYPHYLRSIASNLSPGSRVLLLGLGGGIVARELQELGLQVDGVELDGRIATVARTYFGLDRNSNTFVDDARHYLRTTRKKYDLIIFDVFRAEVPPAHLLTLETFKTVQDRLERGGFMIVNYNGFLTGPIGKGGRSILKTLRAAEYDVHLVPTSGSEKARNSIFIASTGGLDLTRPRTPLIVDGRVRPIPGMYLDTSRIDANDAVILRDNRPVLENLTLAAAKLWREDYTKVYTKQFVEMGIPLFE